MSSPPPPATEHDPTAPGAAGSVRDTGPRVSAADARALGRLRRSRTDRQVAGLCGGLGRHLDVDPTIIRVAFVALTIFGGAGLLLYAAGWLLVPEEGSAHARVDLEPGARTALLVAAGIAALVTMLGHPWGWGWGWGWELVPISLLGLAVLAVVAGRGSRSGGAGPGSAPPAPPPAQSGADAPTVSLEKRDAGLPAPGWVGVGGAAPHPAYAGWVPPPAAPPPTPPRRRGPRLALPTLALILLGWGVLWTVDLGHEVPSSAYAALALAACGLGLVVSAWYGRGWGVFLLGLVAALGLAGTLATQNGVGQREVRPVAAAELAASYRLGIGQIVVDLTGVADPEALDGRTLRLDADLGQIVVDVPRGLDVVATASASGGQVEVFGRTDDGDQPTLTGEHDGGARAPRLTIDAELGYGQITVRSS